MDEKSLAHTTCNCKYHIVFALKYRRMVIYGRYRVEIVKVLRTLCSRKGIEIIKVELCQDNVHMLVSIPPKLSVAGAMGFLKGRSFWCRGYYVDTVEKNAEKIRQYIRNQLVEGRRSDDMVHPDLLDPFFIPGDDKGIRLEMDV